MTDAATYDATYDVPEGLELDRDGAVLVVRLHRPQRRNAIDIDTCVAMTDVLLAADRDPDVRAIVVTGTERDFCTGADAVADNDAVEAMATLDYRFATSDFNRLFQVMWELETPMVSAVNGTVAGAGWLMALLADLVVAAEGARWTHVFARRGMVPHAGDPYFLPRIIPFHRLNELALLSDPVTSDTLHEWGVVNRLAPAGDVVSTAMGLADRLAHGPRSLGLTKRLYRRSLESDMATSFAEERAAIALVSTTRDRLEGVESFVQSRPAAFTGR